MAPLYNMLFANMLDKAIFRAKNYFYFSAKPKFINPIYYSRRLNEKNSEKEFQKIDNGELNMVISALLKKSDSTGCEYSDYMSLWNELNKLNPKCILELGSGITSAIIAYYIKTRSKNSSAKFISMEENEYYFNNIKSIFPKNLEKYVEFHLSERVEKIYNGLTGCHYKIVPDLNYDFIFIDGPVDRAKFNDPNYPKTFNSDLVNYILKKKNSVNAMLDQRILTLMAFKKLLPKADIKYYASKKITILKDVNQSQLKL